VTLEQFIVEKEVPCKFFWAFWLFSSSFCFVVLTPVCYSLSSVCFWFT